jgi:hypothetical protein
MWISHYNLTQKAAKVKQKSQFLARLSNIGHSLPSLCAGYRMSSSFFVSRNLCGKFVEEEPTASR